MSWSREQVTMLIEVYKNHPCLYVVKSPQYKNKHARNAALTDICSKLEAVKAGVTIADVKNKFAALRQNFLVEYRKHENSMKSGSGTDQVYIPTIWYYDLMLFVLEHSIAKTAIYDSIPKPLSPSLSSDSNIESLEFTDISQLEVVYEDEPDDSQTEEVFPYICQ
uniref:MADF domain-containing protein n=1 Tax=Photinus pyralis TaxID=7054 RepID=A0A1Y1JZ87_PHOPY